MNIDPLRHIDVFPPHAWGDRQVDVIGCGATGSRIVLSLGKLGVRNIHVWDFDVVEDHNIANQIYVPADVGRPKVEALASHVLAATGTTLSVHNERMGGKGTQTLGEVVFLLTDTMSSRQEIWAGAIKYRPFISLLVETRMGADSGRIYALNPNRPNEIKTYEETLDGTDAEAEVSSCGGPISVGPTAEVISGLAVWQMIRWFKIEHGTPAPGTQPDEMDNEILFHLRPMTSLSRKFARRPVAAVA